MPGVRSRETYTVPKSEIKYQIEGVDLDAAEIESLLTELLFQILDQVTADVTEWINDKVPKATGELRESLKTALKHSQVKDMVGIIWLRSDMYYATYVNDMTTQQVRHDNVPGRDKYGNKIMLNDPDAIGHFFDELKTFTRERIDINIDKAKLRIKSMYKQGSWRANWNAFNRETKKKL